MVLTAGRMTCVQLRTFEERLKPAMSTGCGTLANPASARELDVDVSGTDLL